jgi:hypothetical protein
MLASAAGRAHERFVRAAAVLAARPHQSRKRAACR